MKDGARSESLSRRCIIAFLLVISLTIHGCTLPPSDTLSRKICDNIIMPERGSLPHLDPAQLPQARIPDMPSPRTVTDPRPETTEWQLSLDDAIRISLENAKVIRVLSGTTAVSSGQTIYDPATAQATIDQAQAVFDPTLQQNNQWSRTNTPEAFPDLLDPTRTDITSTPTDAYLSTLGVTKTNVLGGQWGLTWMENPMRFSGSSLLSNPLLPGSGFPLNPETPNSLALSYTQPLLQGAGFRYNTAPIVIARLNTEQSYFQFKDSVQENVRSVIEAYWELVQARVDAWARKIQVQQSQEAYEREKARLKTGLGDLGTEAQARVTYNQFRANQIAADANVLTREDALRNLLGLPPEDGRRIVPVSAPTSKRLTPDWEATVHLAQERRPDIIELKLIAQADQLHLLQAENQMLPQLNLVTSYTWNGLEGTMPNGEELSTKPGQFTNWAVGVNFSVPLGMRLGRAKVRQQRLLIAHDQANVEQGVHAALHELASTIRDLDSAYDQYLAYKETRVAADINVRVQNEKFRTGQSIYLNVLQALNDWGTAVSSEATQLQNYNVALAALERRTGTILETHGLVLNEERFRAAGPLLLPPFDRMYPLAVVPGGTPQQYPGTGEPSENFFDLRNPSARENKEK